MPTKKNVSIATRTSAALLTLASLVATVLAVLPATAKVANNQADVVNQSVQGIVRIPTEVSDGARARAVGSRRSPRRKTHADRARKTKRTGFSWPVKKARITVPFGWRRRFTLEDGVIVPEPGREFHHGIDIACDLGDPVRTSKPGVVLLSGVTPEYGNVVVVGHPGGWSTLYGHLEARWVYSGERLRNRQLIGPCGMTGRATGPHVHFEIRRNGRFYNPRPFLP